MFVFLHGVVLTRRTFYATSSGSYDVSLHARPCGTLSACPRLLFVSVQISEHEALTLQMGSTTQDCSGHQPVALPKQQPASPMPWVTVSAQGPYPRARIDLNEAGRSSRTPAANVQQIVRSQSYMLEVVMQRTRHDDVAVADADVCSSKDSNAFANFASAWAPAVYQMAYTAACF